MKYFPLLLTLWFFPALSHAVYGERWYNVEVIIFAYTSDLALSDERWPVEPGSPDSSHSVTLIEHNVDSELERLPGQIIEFEALPFEMLASALKRMQRSSEYNVIYSRAWRLPDLPKKTAPPVRIQAGLRYTEEGQIAPPIVLNQPLNTSSNSAVINPQALIDVALYEIDGRIKISLSKYLDVDADLLYRRPVTLPDANGLPVREFRQFRLTEYRRMKSKTIHYLDHPLFGMVIGIDRYEPEENPEIALPGRLREINR